MLEVLGLPKITLHRYPKRTYTRDAQTLGARVTKFCAVALNIFSVST